MPLDFFVKFAFGGVVENAFPDKTKEFTKRFENVAFVLGTAPGVNLRIAGIIAEYRDGFRCRPNAFLKPTAHDEVPFAVVADLIRLPVAIDFAAPRTWFLGAAHYSSRFLKALNIFVKSRRIDLLNLTDPLASRLRQWGLFQNQTLTILGPQCKT